MAFIVEAAKGTSHDGRGSVLDRKIVAVEDKTVVSLGSSEMVRQSVGALQEGS